jgi:hypothetical protein
MKKYALYPDYIISKTDGEKHYITAKDLARLYGVKMSECIIVETLDDILSTRDKDLIALYPRYDGDYILPEKEDLWWWDVHDFYKGKYLHVWGNWFAKDAYFWGIKYSRWKAFFNFHRLAFQFGKGEVIFDFYPKGNLK